MKFPHDIRVLRKFVYAVGDRDWTDAELAHAVDLVRAIWNRCAGKRSSGTKGAP